MSDSHTTESHSAVFGLDPQSEPTKNAGSGPGTGIEGTTGVKGHKNSTAKTVSGDGGTSDSTVAGIPEPNDTGSAAPGSGSSIMKPSQGSNKNADESGGLLNKLNPLK